MQADSSAKKQLVSSPIHILTVSDITFNLYGLFYSFVEADLFYSWPALPPSDRDVADVCRRPSSPPPHGDLGEER